MKVSKEMRNVGLGVLALLVLLFLIRFNVTGLRVALGFIIIYLLPMYYIIKNSSLDNEEKIFFTVFLSIGIVPSITYIVGFLSLRLGLVVSVVVLVVLGYFMGRNKTKIPEQQTS